MQALKIGLLLAFISITMTVKANVQIQGYYKVKVSSPSTEFKEQAVKIALAKGIKEFVSNKQREFLPFFNQFASLSVLAEKVDGLVTNYEVLEQDYKHKYLTTEVVGELDLNTLKLRLAKFSAVNRVDKAQRSEFAFVFLGRKACLLKSCKSAYEKIGLSEEVSSTFEEAFQNSGYRVLPNYQFEQQTGGAFNKHLLEKRFVNTGLVDWNKAELAAQMSTKSNVGLYMVVGTFEMLSVNKNDYDTALWDASVKLNAKVVDVHNYNEIYATSISYVDTHRTVLKATDIALKIASKKISEKIINKMQSINIY